MTRDVLVIALTPIESRGDGVAVKVRSEATGIHKNGRRVDILCYDDNGPALYEVSDEGLTHIRSFDNTNSLRWKSLFASVAELLKDRQYEKAYIRYPRLSKAFVNALKLLKRQGMKLILEIPTYPLHFDKPSGLKDFLIKLVFAVNEIIYAPQLRKYLDEVYVMGPVDKMVYNVPSRSVPNGVDPDVYPLRTPDAPGGDIHIVIASNFFKHHGIDRLITGLGEFYRNNGQGVYLELVGDGPERGRAVALAQKCGVDKYVSFPGLKSGAEYDEIYNHCQIASSCLGFARMGYTLVSPLKSREYMLRGIPYIYCYDEMELDADFPYAMRIKDIDGPIDIGSVIEFYRTYENEQALAAQKMRDYSLNKYTWQSILKDI